MKQICLGCGQKNPYEAVMCWACFYEFQPVAIKTLRAAPIPDEAPIVGMANTILDYAIKDQATEIHIEAVSLGVPEMFGVRILYRIDGKLCEQMKVPDFILRPLTQRIKLMADMDIFNSRTSQQGRIPILMNDKDYSVRVQTSPAEYGERIVMSFNQ